MLLTCVGLALRTCNKVLGENTLCFDISFVRKLLVQARTDREPQKNGCHFSTPIRESAVRKCSFSFHGSRWQKDLPVIVEKIRTLDGPVHFWNMNLVLMGFVWAFCTMHKRLLTSVPGHWYISGTWILIKWGYFGLFLQCTDFKRLLTPVPGAIWAPAFHKTIISPEPS